MSSNTNVIHVQLSSVKDAQRVPVHLMPCEIEHNGPAQVLQYFDATTKDCKQGTRTYIQIIFMQCSNQNPVYFCHYREDCVIQRAWAEGTGPLLPTGLHWAGAERN